MYIQRDVLYQHKSQRTILTTVHLLDCDSDVVDGIVVNVVFAFVRDDIVLVTATEYEVRTDSVDVNSDVSVAAVVDVVIDNVAGCAMSVV